MSTTVYRASRHLATEVVLGNYSKVNSTRIRLVGPNQESGPLLPHAFICFPSQCLIRCPANGNVCTFTRNLRAVVYRMEINGEHFKDTVKPHHFQLCGTDILTLASRIAVFCFWTVQPIPLLPVHHKLRLAGPKPEA